MSLTVTGLRSPATPTPLLTLALQRMRRWLRQRRQARVLHHVDARLREDAGLPCILPAVGAAVPGCLPVWAMGAFAVVRPGAERRGPPRA